MPTAYVSGNRVREGRIVVKGQLRIARQRNLPCLNRHACDGTVRVHAAFRSRCCRRRIERED